MPPPKQKNEIKKNTFTYFRGVTKKKLVSYDDLNFLQNEKQTYHKAKNQLQKKTKQTKKSKINQQKKQKILSKLKLNANTH